MKYSELIQLFFERSNALQWYWTLYVVILGGLLAFSSLRHQRNLVTTLLITILFCCFAYKNLGAIEDVTVQRLAVKEAIRQQPKSDADGGDLKKIDELLWPTLITPDVQGISNFHVMCDVLTVLALWAMEWRRAKILRDGVIAGGNATI
jgi:hypothetical protein